MLKIYMDEIGNEDSVVRDVEKMFSQIKLQGTEIERQLISLIEQGEYNDSSSFVDRFGFKLRFSEMSTGCKAALCVVNCTDRIIDLLECGNNARDVIISLCKQGNILLRDNGITFKNYNMDGMIDVEIDAYRIFNIDRLNKYVFDERPYEADLSTGGIERV